MAKSGPIMILEDDLDDQDLIKIVLCDIGVTNPILFLKNGYEGLRYLRTAKDLPFLILSDVYMPLMDGIEFKRQIDQDLEPMTKNIPFVFFTTSVNKIAVNLAFSMMNVQGFFEKPSTYKELKSTLQLILDYWRACKLPGQGWL